MDYVLIVFHLEYYTYRVYIYKEGRLCLYFPIPIWCITRWFASIRGLFRKYTKKNILSQFIALYEIEILQNYIYRIKWFHVSAKLIENIWELCLLWLMFYFLHFCALSNSCINTPFSCNLYSLTFWSKFVLKLRFFLNYNFPHPTM